MELRKYQKELANQGKEILEKYGIVYYAMEVRTGKTIVALETAKISSKKNVLFITKKRAFSSILGDYEHYKDSFKIEVINKESIHKLENTSQYDLVVIDEAHGFGSFPKPSENTKKVKKLFHKLPIIFLSGTPSPESYSQLYHQFFISDRSPWRQYTNFYKWANDYVKKGFIFTTYGQAIDYSEANIDKIKEDIKNIVLNYSQEQAGFETKIQEKIHYIKMSSVTYKLAETLKRDRVIEGKNDVILADTGVSLQQKLHQIYSGTVKMEQSSITLDKTKAEYIKNTFKGKKLGIFYIYKQELELLKEVLDITEDLDEFRTTKKSIALQIVSGREGISLKEADDLIFYNLSFSAVSYWQGRDRLTTSDRKENNVHFLFSECGIEKEIYKAISKKKNFTLSHFEKWQKSKNYSQG